MYHIFLIHSSVEGHLGCFHVWAIVNSAALNLDTSLFVKKKTTSPNPNLYQWRDMERRTHTWRYLACPAP